MRISSVLGDDPVAVSQAGDLLDEYRVHYGRERSAGAATGWLRTQLQSGKLLVFLAFSPGDEPIGFACVSVVPASLVLGFGWQLRDLYVAPGWRRQGVGSRLLEHVVAAAREAGAVRVSLQTERENRSALRLYQAHGFAVIDELRLLYRPLADTM